MAWLCTNGTAEKIQQHFGFVPQKQFIIAEGITESINTNYVFMPPVVNGWQLVFGKKWIELINDFTYDKLKAQLETTSSGLGEVQFFCQKPDIKFSMWAKAVDGKMQRIYVWLGDESENLLIEGEPTEAEKEFMLVDTLLPEHQADDYYFEDDLVMPDQLFVYELAARWSINPKELIKNQTVYGEGRLGSIVL
jgi:hypothetical protein